MLAPLGWSGHGEVAPLRAVEHRLLARLKRCELIAPILHNLVMIGRHDIVSDPFRGTIEPVHRCSPEKGSSNFARHAYVGPKPIVSQDGRSNDRRIKD